MIWHLRKEALSTNTSKVDIEAPKVDIESLLFDKNIAFSAKTVIHIHRLFEKFGFEEIFGKGKYRFKK